jgi:hypothetical protein
MNERADQAVPQPVMLLLAACADPSAVGASAPQVPHQAPVPDACPSPAQPSAVRTQVPAGQQAVALTVDDGPDPRWTQEILAVLRNHGIRATFCMIGVNVQARPDIARAVAADRHEIANHTWSHADLARLGADQIRRSSGGAPARGTTGAESTG